MNFNFFHSCHIIKKTNSYDICLKVFFVYLKQFSLCIYLPMFATINKDKQGLFLWSRETTMRTRWDGSSAYSSFNKPRAIESNKTRFYIHNIIFHTIKSSAWVNHDKWMLTFPTARCNECDGATCQLLTVQSHSELRRKLRGSPPCERFILSIIMPIAMARK